MHACITLISKNPHGDEHAMPEELLLWGTGVSAIWRYSSLLTEARLQHPGFRILWCKSSACEPFRVKVHIQGVSPFPGKVQQSLHNIPWQGQTYCGSWACPSPQMGPLCLGELKSQRDAQHLGWGLCKQLGSSQRFSFLALAQLFNCIPHLWLPSSCSWHCIATAPWPVLSLPSASFSFTPCLLFHLTPGCLAIH